MAFLNISQREARRLRARVRHLEEVLHKERRTWAQEWVGGIDIGRTQWPANAEVPVALRTARKLGHAVVVTVEESGLVKFHALPLAKAEGR